MGSPSLVKAHPDSILSDAVQRAEAEAWRRPLSIWVPQEGGLHSPVLGPGSRHVERSTT